MKASLAFKRLDEWKVETHPGQQESTPPLMPEGTTITCIDEINQHMNRIGVNIKPFPLDQRIHDKAIQDKLVSGGSNGNPATHDEVLRALNVDSKQEWMDVIADGKREAMYDISEMHMSTNEEGVPPYPKIYDLSTITKKDKAYLVNKFARLHFNFWQGGDKDGVDPNRKPMSVDERMVLLPRTSAHSKIPWFWFFYMGHGVVAKLRLEPSANVGIEMSYPGIWPHGAAFVADGGMCHAQITCGKPTWHLRYDMKYKNSASTSELYKTNHNGVAPDYDKVLGKNPWCDFSPYIDGGDKVPILLDE